MASKVVQDAVYIVKLYRTIQAYERAAVGDINGDYHLLCRNAISPPIHKKGGNINRDEYYDKSEATRLWREEKHRLTLDAIKYCQKLGWAVQEDDLTLAVYDGPCKVTHRVDFTDLDSVNN